jgi:hypothetical protein
MEGVGESATIVGAKYNTIFTTNNAFCFLLQTKPKMMATMPKKSHGNYELYPIHLELFL